MCIRDRVITDTNDDDDDDVDDDDNNDEDGGGGGDKETANVFSDTPSKRPRERGGDDASQAKKPAASKPAQPSGSNDPVVEPAEGGQ